MQHRIKFFLEAYKTIFVLIVLCLALATFPHNYAVALNVNVSTYGAKGDGVSDDTAAIQAAMDAVAAAGGGVVNFSAGTFLLNTANQSPNGWYFYNLHVPSNVTLQGVTGTKLLQGPAGRHAKVAGATEVRNTVLAVGNNYVTVTFQDPASNGGFYNLRATNAGDAYVTLSSLANVSKFTAGDYIAFYETTSGDVNPAQMAKITAVNSSNGQLTLNHPVSRSFATPTIANVTARAAHDIAINNLIVQGAEPLAVTETFGFTAQNNQFLSDTSIGGGNIYQLQLNTVQDYNFTGNTFSVVNGPLIYQEMPQRDSQYGIIDNNIFNVVSVGFGEYAAHIQMTNNHITVHPVSTIPEGVGLGGLDILFSGNDITTAGNMTNGSGWGFILADDYGVPAAYVGQVRITNNTIGCVADGNNCILVSNQDTVVTGNTINATGSAVGIHVEGAPTQTIQISNNHINIGTGAGVLIYTPPVDATTITNNIFTATAGWRGIFVGSPPTPDTGGYQIYGNTFTGFAMDLDIDMALHPGTILTAPATTKYPRSISLTSLEGLSSIPSNQSITAKVLSGSTVLSTQSLTPTSGKYTVTFQSSDPQLVDIRISVNGYLSAKLTSIDTTVNSSSALMVSQLYTGDFNNDNTINTLDYSLLNTHYNQNFTTADINKDGLVNSLDFAILKNNWNRVGQ